MIPGSNILKMALRAIKKQTVGYKKYLGAAVGASGKKTPSYDPLISITGSLQPIEKKLYQSLGLAFEKSYSYFYTPNNILVPGRDVKGDQIIANGYLYECESSDDWYSVDGWVKILCVRQGVA